jgi:hypothetical protein
MLLFPTILSSSYELGLLNPKTPIKSYEPGSAAQSLRVHGKDQKRVF